MTSSAPQTPVPPDLLVAGATILTAGAELAAGRKPSARVFIGGTVAAFVLSALAGPAPGIARGLATLAILAAVLTSGYALAKPIAKLVA